MSASETQTPSSQPAAEPRAHAPAIDLRALADKVYALMLADIRLERARGIPPAHPKKG